MKMAVERGDEDDVVMQIARVWPSEGCGDLAVTWYRLLWY